ncbi:hypothetical protein CCUS01_08210 [Colletotrichum cuscutae]|uniref:Uncharacterized protein n=1 Tax=Colletotrichum cuscutae TaxID=1209917 RepID=A0AAI9UXD2_9PEZI|nr:hypothetical protein CCUS01_08210 [Colletotrichum cuscutae]
MMSPRPSVMSYPPCFSAAPLSAHLLSPKELPLALEPLPLDASY